MYKSKFQASNLSNNVLRKGRMIDESETPGMMVERVVNSLFEVEKKFGTDNAEIEKLKDEMGNYLDSKLCIFSTPILTNAGRHISRPLSACTIPSVNLQSTLKNITKVVNKLHIEGMGTGFDLDVLDDPIATLMMLNNIARKGAASGKEERPVGNIGILSIDHPEIKRFILVKKEVENNNWKFNLSVNLTDVFMDSLKNRKWFYTKDGTKHDPQHLLNLISETAYHSAEPGVVFMDRMNNDNPLPCLGDYHATAPCGEIALLPGESCQFGYINLGQFVVNQKFDWDKLEKVAKLMTRALDNAVEISIENFSMEHNKQIMRLKRSIGVGICGLADMFIKLGLDYDQPESSVIAKEVMLFINYISKHTSYELSKTRGSFEAMNIHKEGNRYLDENDYITKKYAHLDTPKVSSQMWKDLASHIKQEKSLRNGITVALPPTGRSSMVIDASASIEPLFNHANLTPELQKIKKETKNPNLFKTATKISVHDHLRMVGEIAQTVDSSISKTINIDSTASISEVFSVFAKSYDLGLKGITVYRDQSLLVQPKIL